MRANDRSCCSCVSFVLSKGRAKMDVPEIVGTVLVAHEYEGNLGVILGWEDTDSGSRIVFIGVCTQSLVELLN